MEIKFREFNPFDLWIWLEFETVPSHSEKQYIEEVFNSWFYLGKLGAFNAENLQVQDAGVDISYINYNTDILDNSMMALMHNIGDFEYKGLWGRCWLDLGTSDLFALDILISSLNQLNKELVTIKQFIVGGENEDWRIVKQEKSMFVDQDSV